MSCNIFKAGDVMLPAGVDFSKWSVVACDQYTSQPEYWQQVKDSVGDAPSTLNITLPEIYLEQKDVLAKIESINSTMRKYIDSKVLTETKKRFIYVERTQQNGAVRKGLVGVIDLEEYSYLPSSQSLVRATEGTVLERIPPRVRVRENAALELPHVMLLIDDREATVIEPLSKKKDTLSLAYRFTLMQGGGDIEGYFVDPAEEKRICGAIDALAEPEAFSEKYNVRDKGVLLFAVGDGNHSLATAKECFERIKAKLPRELWEVHPARYALVEVVNIHDTALEFEPIHRVVFDVNPTDLLHKLKKTYEITDDINCGQSFSYVCEESTGTICVKNPPSHLAVGTLQRFLDSYIKEYGGRVDYIHGDDVASELGKKPDCIAFLLPKMEKRELFETVIEDGVLPRKTFSMGHANDKRFYLEARRITID